jgi:hypothetical protein
MQTVYEATFGKDTLPLATGGKAFPIRPDALTDQQIAAFFRYGKRALNDSYNSEAKAAKDSGKARPDPKAYMEDWLKHWGAKTAKTRGPQGSTEDRADKAWFISKGRKTTMEDLPQAWIERTAILLVNGKKADTPAAAMEMVRADATWIDKAKGVVRGTEDWKAFHAAEIAKDKAKEPEIDESLALT